MDILINLAVLIFTMLVGYFFLHARHIRPMTRQYAKLMDMQTKLLRLFSDFEDMMDGFEEYVEEIRTEIVDQREKLDAAQREVNKKNEETLAVRADTEEMMRQCMQDIEALKKDLHYVTQMQQDAAAKSAQQQAVGANERLKDVELMPVQFARPKQSVSVGSVNQRHERVRELMAEGLNADEIAQRTGFSKGEVQLILEMWQGVSVDAHEGY